MTSLMFIIVYLSNSVHFVKDFLSLAFYLDANCIPEVFKVCRQLVEVSGDVPRVDNHHHVEISGDNRLGNVKDIYVVLCQIRADFCNNADRIPADHCDYAPVHFYVFVW